MYAYSVVHVLRYLYQKTQAQNDFVISILSIVSFFGHFSMETYVDFFHIFKDISVHNSKASL